MRLFLLKISISDTASVDYVHSMVSFLKGRSIHFWSLFWSKLDLKTKILPTSGCFGENCFLKLVLVYLIPTQWWNKRKWLDLPFNDHNDDDDDDCSWSMPMMMMMTVDGKDGFRAEGCNSANVT